MHNAAVAQPTSPPGQTGRTPIGVRFASYGVVLVLMLASVFLVREFRHAPKPFAALTPVRLMVGTENLPFLSDSRVLEAFARHGFHLEVSGEGSRQMAENPRTCHDYDLAIASSQPAADAIAANSCPNQGSYPVFTSPMVVSTFQDVVQPLEQLGIARQDPRTRIWTFDVRQYVNAVNATQRWNTVAGGRTYHYSQNQVLLNTTDPCYSNSASMYIAMLSYALNDYNVVTDDQQATDQGQSISRRFIDPLGYLPSSTQYTFEDYLGSLGESTTPMMLAYEAQFLDVEMNHPDQIATNHMVVMYPSTTAVATHTAVAITAVGNTVGQLLSGAIPDPDILRLEAEHGFRTLDPGDTFDTVMREHHITGLPAQPQLDDARLPTYRFLEDLLNCT
jgi:hypothetical protein